MKKLALAAALLALSACSYLQKERRLAPADQTYQVDSVVVVPFPLTYRSCPEDIDKKARTDDLFGDITAAATNALRNRGYKVPTILVDPTSDALKGYYKELGKRLCAGETLGALPPALEGFVKEQAQRAKASAVLLGGVSRLRWHLKLDKDQDNGHVGNASGSSSEFEIKATAALYDVKTGRVVWSEVVESSLVGNNYNDAINHVFLFDELRTTDPHDKLFYDFPRPVGAAPSAATAQN